MPQRPCPFAPTNVAVALQLSLTAEASYAELARRAGVSVGEAHNSVKRLERTQLLTVKGQRPNPRRLIEFLLHGVPNVFPGHLGSETRGVPTAHGGPDLREQLVFDTEIVWPSVNDEVIAARCDRPA